MLNGLGFGQKDWQRPCEEFSGGWQMRIALARLLLQSPSLLLLDEPTNHLDLEARNWLEDFLQNYPHALVLVSHDRFFLDATIDRIVEIRNRAVHFYKGNYEQFLQQRDLRMTQLVAAYEAQQKEIARIKAFADKFRYKATKAAQVQSRLKELERMERIELPPEAKPIHFRFPEGPRTGRVVLELAHVTAGYGGDPVFRDLNLILEKGDRVALVGPERRRQIDPDEDPGRPAAALGRESHRGAQRHGLLLFTGPGRPARFEQDRLGRGLLRRARLHHAAAAHPARLLPVFRAIPSKSRSRCSAAASAAGWCCASCCSRRPTASCSTSRRITWTSGPRTS